MEGEQHGDGQGAEAGRGAALRLGRIDGKARIADGMLVPGKGIEGFCSCSYRVSEQFGHRTRGRGTAFTGVEPFVVV